MPADVLVVDDDDGIRTLVRVNLELDGFTVREAPDGPSALAAVGERVPDLVVLDVMLPGMDGWAVLQRLKADDATAPVPVLLLTARTADEDQVRAWDEGVAEYLAKPFHPTSLVSWAREALVPLDPAAAEARRARILEQLRLLRDLRS